MRGPHGRDFFLIPFEANAENTISMQKREATLQNWRFKQEPPDLGTSNSRISAHVAAGIIQSYIYIIFCLQS